MRVGTFDTELADLPRRTHTGSTNKSIRKWSAAAVSPFLYYPSQQIWKPSMAMERGWMADTMKNFVQCVSIFHYYYFFLCYWRGEGGKEGALIKDEQLPKICEQCPNFQNYQSHLQL